MSQATRIYPSAIERFELYVVRNSNDQCWGWTGGRSSSGYAQFVYGAGSYGAHRYSYMEFVGPIPAGMIVHHVCRNKICTNPGHLEVVTRAEHTQRHGAYSAVHT